MPGTRMRANPDAANLVKVTFQAMIDAQAGNGWRQSGNLAYHATKLALEFSNLLRGRLQPQDAGHQDARKSGCCLPQSVNKFRTEGRIAIKTFGDTQGGHGNSQIGRAHV